MRSGAGKDQDRMKTGMRQSRGKNQTGLERTKQETGGSSKVESQDKRPGVERGTERK